MSSTREIAERIVAGSQGEGDARDIALVFEIDAALRQRELEVRAEVWQPIESAPKDGREVLLLVESRAGIKYGMLVGHYMPGGHCIEDHPAIDEGWYFWSGGMFDIAAKPLYWMPLPDPPSLRRDSEAQEGEHANEMH